MTSPSYTPYCEPNDAWQRLLRWTVALLFISLFASLFWVVSVERRGKWLCEAAWHDNTGKAKLLVWLGTDVNYSTGNGTALYGAAANGNIELMEFLVQHGATVDALGKFGQTPLWQARESKQSAAEQWLIDHGANPYTSHIHLP
jgi:Ankyrin repeats (3 copies)